jgi:hypothetical protein
MRDSNKFSPSRLSVATRTGPEMGDLKIDVRTSLPCQSTSRGIPTLTDMSFRADIK